MPEGLADTAIALFRSWLIERFGARGARCAAGRAAGGRERITGSAVKSDARVVVIGGGVVGVSVLYHLTKAGWKDVLLIERGELTCGSTWHAAGGMHTVNGDPNVAKLQQYTINLYKEMESLSGQSCGMHLTGGIMLAGTRERLDWLKMAKARGRYLGMELELISVEEAARLFPLMNQKHFVGALLRSDRGTRRSLGRHAGLRQGRAARRRRGGAAQPRLELEGARATAAGT